MEQKISIKGLIKNNKVFFDSFRQGIFYYNIPDDLENEIDCYQFPVPLDDIGTATLLKEDKAIFYMRWIRKAIGEGTLIQINK